MSEKSNIVEKIILFAVFVVFAIIIVSFAFNMERIDVKEPQSDGSFQYVTSSKPEYKSSYDKQVRNLPSDGGDSFDGTVSVPASGGKINLNTATVEQLISLPGIGEKKAEAIIKYRNEHGRFSSTEQLLDVSGIGDATYEKIKDLVTAE